MEIPKELLPHSALGVCLYFVFFLPGYYWEEKISLRCLWFSIKVDSQILQSARPDWGKFSLRPTFGRPRHFLEKQPKQMATFLATFYLSKFYTFFISISNFEGQFVAGILRFQQCFDVDGLDIQTEALVFWSLDSKNVLATFSKIQAKFFYILVTLPSSFRKQSSIS